MNIIMIPTIIIKCLFFITAYTIVLQFFLLNNKIEKNINTINN